MLLAMVRGIISFQVKILCEWGKHIPLSPDIYHVGGGAHDAYTNYKQNMVKNYRFIQLGETTLIGAAKLAMQTLD